MTPDPSDVLVEGLTFPEGPRWHEGRWWVSDIHDRAVLSVGPDGTTERVCEVESLPSGLGWLPDGRLLVVSMLDQRILRQEADGTLVEHADLSELASWWCNDMVVDGSGRAWVGNFGFDLWSGSARYHPGEILRVDPDGTVTCVADSLMFPNGAVVTPDGATLIVAETFGRRLTGFDIDTDGALGGRDTWADLGEGVPDGIALDAEGAVWWADPVGRGCHRITAEGALTHTVAADARVFACALGGDDRATLLLCCAEHHEPDRAAAERLGRLLTVEVEVPGAGWP